MYYRIAIFVGAILFSKLLRAGSPPPVEFPACVKVHEQILKEGFVKVYHKYYNTPKGVGAEALYRQVKGAMLLKLIVAPVDSGIEGIDPVGICLTGDGGRVFRPHLFYILPGKMDLVSEPLPKHKT
jgi:hypothetical protein